MVDFVESRQSWPSRFGPIHTSDSRKDVRHTGDRNNPLSTKSIKLNMFDIFAKVEWAVTVDFRQIGDKVKSIGDKSATRSTLSPLCSMLKNCSYRCVHIIVQLWYTIQHRSVLLIFCLILQTLIIAVMLYIGGEEISKESRTLYIHILVLQLCLLLAVLSKSLIDRTVVTHWSFCRQCCMLLPVWCYFCRVLLMISSDVLVLYRVWLNVPLQFGAVCDFVVIVMISHLQSV